jgi:hypothetical protein
LHSGHPSGKEERVRIKSSLKTLVVATSLTSACGTPTSPTPNPDPGPGAGSTVTVSSLMTGAPLGGVSVSAGGMTAATDASGRATFQQAIPAGTMLAFTLGGHLTREAPFRQNGMAESVMTEIPENVLVGTIFRTRESPSVRWPNGSRICIVPTSDFRDVMGYFEEGVNWVVRDLGPGLAKADVSVSLAASPAGCSQVPATLDPNCPEAGMTFGSGRTSASICFQKLVYITSDLIAHEVGHVIGFGHNTRSDGMMNVSSLNKREFTAEEKLASILLYGRPEGLVWKDKSER